MTNIDWNPFHSPTFNAVAPSLIQNGSTALNALLPGVGSIAGNLATQAVAANLQPSQPQAAEPATAAPASQPTVVIQQPPPAPATGAGKWPWYAWVGIGLGVLLVLFLLFKFVL